MLAPRSQPFVRQGSTPPVQQPAPLALQENTQALGRQVAYSASLASINTTLSKRSASRASWDRIRQPWGRQPAITARPAITRPARATTPARAARLASTRLLLEQRALVTARAAALDFISTWLRALHVLPALQDRTNLPQGKQRAMTAPLERIARLRGAPRHAPICVRLASTRRRALQLARHARSGASESPRALGHARVALPGRIQPPLDAPQRAPTHVRPASTQRTEPRAAPFVMSGPIRLRAPPAVWHAPRARTHPRQAPGRASFALSIRTRPRERPRARSATSADPRMPVRRVASDSPRLSRRRIRLSCPRSFPQLRVSRCPRDSVAVPPWDRWPSAVSRAC